MIIRTLAACFITLCLAQAQDKPVKVHASFYAFDYAPGHDTLFCRSGPEAFEEITLSKANIVGPVQATLVEGNIQLCAKPVTAPDGKVTHPVVATAAVGTGMNRVLVVLFPNPSDAKTAYRAVVFDHNARAFPLGTYRVINLAPNPIRGAIGSQVVSAKPGAVENLELKGEPGSIAPVRFEYQEDGRWNLLTETRCAIRKDLRWLMCVYKDPRTGRYNMRTIPDRTQPPASDQD